MISQDQARDLIGGTLFGPGDEKIGSIGQVFLDDETGQPEWVTVSTGLFGTRETFVPIAQGTVSGSELTVPYDKDKIKGAPTVDVEGGHLSQAEEAELYAYYGLGYTEARSDSGLPAGESAGYASTGRTDADRDGVFDDVEGRTVGHDTSGPTTDDAMTRSEEQVRVGTRQEESGRVRLRKYVVTEQVQQTVPVRREEVRVEREPITGENVDRAVDGPAFSEEEHEVVLHEERPVVEKEAVPVERVRLAKDAVEEQETVSTERRKEVIETDGAEAGLTETERR